MERITRRRLPHWYVPGAAHFVTYRIAGTIPRSVIEELQDRQALRLRQLSGHGAARREIVQRVLKQSFAAYDDYLDRCREIDWLAQPEVASILQENLYRHRGSKYQLLAYSIMPNHVHVLIKPLAGLPQLDSTSTSQTEQAGSSPADEQWIEKPDRSGPLAKIMHSLKSYTANRVNEILQRSGQFWQHESYDHWVRDDGELERVVEYIAANPIKAGLCSRSDEWPWSSAHDQFKATGDGSGWLTQPAEA